MSNNSNSYYQQASQRVEWQKQLKNGFIKANQSSKKAMCARKNTEIVCKHLNAKTDVMQFKSTKNIRNVLFDINFAINELKCEISDIIAVSSALNYRKITIEKALVATITPMQIVTDNLNIRKLRRKTESVIDDLEITLDKEREFVANVQEVLKHGISRANAQICQNRIAKEKMEVIYSNKIEADNLDTESAWLQNQKTNKQHFSLTNAEKAVMSIPQERIEEVHNAILVAEHERIASESLIGVIDCMLDEMSTDLTNCSNIVIDEAIRNKDLINASEYQIKNKLKQIICDIGLQHANIIYIKEAIQLKDDPIKVAQTRVHLRNQRRGIDLCADSAFKSLEEEISSLDETVVSLQKELEASEEHLAELEACQLDLEKDLHLKRDSYFIDRNQVLPRRALMPTLGQRRGHV